MESRHQPSPSAAQADAGHHDQHDPTTTPNRSTRKRATSSASDTPLIPSNDRLAKRVKTEHSDNAESFTSLPSSATPSTPIRANKNSELYLPTPMSQTKVKMEFGDDVFVKAEYHEDDVYVKSEPIDDEVSIKPELADDEPHVKPEPMDEDPLSPSCDNDLPHDDVDEDEYNRRLAEAFHQLEGNNENSLDDDSLEDILERIKELKPIICGSGENINTSSLYFRDAHVAMTRLVDTSKHLNHILEAIAEAQVLEMEDFALTDKDLKGAKINRDDKLTRPLLLLGQCTSASTDPAKYRDNKKVVQVCFRPLPVSVNMLKKVQQMFIKSSGNNEVRVMPDYTDKKDLTLVSRACLWYSKAEFYNGSCKFTLDPEELAEMKKWKHHQDMKGSLVAIMVVPKRKNKAIWFDLQYCVAFPRESADEFVFEAVGSTVEDGGSSVESDY
ncbi:hypothetical protein HDV05_005593 [Chytridiales sp. JEL 0842]|nr:hypothetical protein HDV05_005593 [Chytridiales sp. JEL 0842]